MRLATERQIEGDPIKAVEVLSERFQFSQTERSGIFRHLIQGADLSSYGLVNAVTRTAQDLPITIVPQSLSGLVGSFWYCHRLIGVKSRKRRRRGIYACEMVYLP